MLGLQERRRYLRNALGNDVVAQYPALPVILLWVLSKFLTTESGSMEVLGSDKLAAAITKVRLQCISARHWLGKEGGTWRCTSTLRGIHVSCRILSCTVAWRRSACLLGALSASC